MARIIYYKDIKEYNKLKRKPIQRNYKKWIYILLFLNICQLIYSLK